MIAKLVVLTVLLAHTLGQVRYDNYQVYRVVPKNQDQAKFLRELEYQSSDYSFWTSVKGTGYNVDIMVPPFSTKKFEDLAQLHDLDSTVVIPNVQHLIDNERPKVKSSEFGWTDYHTLDEINAWLSELAENYDHVTLIKGGTSYEGRDIIGVHVSFVPGNENKSVFIEGNIHACEWIGSAVVTYLLKELLTNIDPVVRQVADSHDWYFFPVINPDGYAYTHTTDRLWRKTRAPHNATCVGADPNRNWGYHFNDGGTSDDPCSGIYRGPEAFSEPNTKSLSEFISTIGTTLEGYIAFHSYSQLLLIPYGYTNEHLDNYDELYEVGVKACEAAGARYGTPYEAGNIVDILYAASGSSLDWIKGTFGTRITYAYELRDRGQYGTVLPADQIIPNGEEILDSVLTIFQEFAKR